MLANKTLPWKLCDQKINLSLDVLTWISVVQELATTKSNLHSQKWATEKDWWPGSCQWFCSKDSIAPKFRMLSLNLSVLFRFGGWGEGCLGNIQWYPGLTPDSMIRNYSWCPRDLIGCRNWIWAGYVQEKHPTHCNLSTILLLLCVYAHVYHS